MLEDVLLAVQDCLAYSQLPSTSEAVFSIFNERIKSIQLQQQNSNLLNKNNENTKTKHKLNLKMCYAVVIRDRLFFTIWVALFEIHPVFTIS
jgi:hypothetical protein